MPLSRPLSQVQRREGGLRPWLLDGSGHTNEEAGGDVGYQSLTSDETGAATMTAYMDLVGMTSDELQGRASDLVEEFPAEAWRLDPRWTRQSNWLLEGLPTQGWESDEEEAEHHDAECAAVAKDTDNALFFRQRLHVRMFPRPGRVRMLVRKFLHGRQRAPCERELRGARRPR